MQQKPHVGFARDCASVSQPFIARGTFPPLSLIYLCAPFPSRLFEDCVTYGEVKLLYYQIVYLYIRIYRCYFYLQYRIVFKYFV
jgi:hypothetical protein